MAMINARKYKSRADIEAARSYAKANHADCVELASDLRRRNETVRASAPEREAKRLEAYLAAFSWLLGDTAQSPITGAELPESDDESVLGRAFFAEEAPGRDMAESGRPPSTDLGRAFTEGYGEAISWYRGLYESLPGLF